MNEKNIVESSPNALVIIKKSKGLIKFIMRALMMQLMILLTKKIDQKRP